MNPCSDEIAKPANKGKLPETERGQVGEERKKRKTESGALPRNCAALMNDTVSENGEEARSFTYQRETGRKGVRRAGGGERWNTTLTT